MGDHRISKEMIHPNVKEEIMASVGNIKLLETEDKTNIVNAINSIKQNKIDKKLLVDAIGSPLETTDTVEEMCGKIDIINDKFKTKLEEKGVNITGVTGYDSLVGKVEEIYQGPRFPEWMNCHVQCIKLPTPYYMGHKSSAVRYSTITACDAGVYSVAGIKDSDGTIVKDIQKFDTASWNWVKVAETTNGTTTRISAYKQTLTPKGLNFYIFGGTSGSNSYSSYHNLFDTVTNSETAKKSMTGRVDVKSVLNDNIIYYMGGASSNNSVNAVYIEAYDINANTTTKEYQGSVILSGNKKALINDGKIYMFIGNVIKVYDLNLKTMSDITTPLTSMNDKGVFLSADRKGIFIVGISNLDSNNDHYYSIENNKWVDLNRKYSPYKTFCHCVEHNGVIYNQIMVGGTSYDDVHIEEFECFVNYNYDDTVNL